MKSPKNNDQKTPVKSGFVDLGNTVLPKLKVKVFRDQNGSPHVDVLDENRILTMSLQNDMLEQALSKILYKTGLDISQKDKDKIISVIRTEALFAKEEYFVGLRSSIINGELYINLGDDNKLFKLSSDGIERVREKSIRFRFSEYLKPLPYEKGIEGNFDLFYKYSPIKKKKHRLLNLTWMVDSFFTNSSYAILLFTGPSGSGKSFQTSMNQALIDPSALGLQSPPSSVKDMTLGAIHGHVQVFNNVTKLTIEQQNLFCIVSTGGNIPSRMLYKNTDILVIELRRPVMLNGLFSPFTQDDVLNRVIQIELPKLTPDDYAVTGGEQHWKQQFENDLSSIFQGFLEILQKVIGIRSTVEIPERLPRMSDFAITGIAVEQVLELEKGTFLQAYEENLMESLTLIIEGSEVAQSLIALTEKMYEPEEHTYKELLGILRKSSSNSRYLPDTAKALSEEVHKVEKALLEVQKIKIKFLERQSDGYKVRIYPPHETNLDF